MQKIMLTLEDQSRLKEVLEHLKKLDFIKVESIYNEDEIDQKLLVSEEAIKYGKTISQSDLEEEIKTWRKPSIPNH